MLDIKQIRKEPGLVRQRLARRGMDTALLDAVIQADALRRSYLAKVEGCRAAHNRISKKVSTISNGALRAAQIEKAKTYKSQLAGLEVVLQKVEERLRNGLAVLPNLPGPRVPQGRTEEDNVVLREDGELADVTFDAKPHWELADAIGLDFQSGVKISGSRFYVIHKGLARLQRGLITFLLDSHTRRGFAEVYLPFVVKKWALFSAGQLPKFEDNLYHDHQDDVWLVPTAEVPLTGLHAREILRAEKLPLRYCAYTPCFRREKMSAGRDVRGIKRGHQFDKVELYTVRVPEHSDDELDYILSTAEKTIKSLGLKYRVKQLCAGDLGFSSQMTYDIETWAPGCREWLEVSSVSNCGTFQARRASIKYEDGANGKRYFACTLNGSGLGIPRTMISIIETYQQENGTVRVPEVLQRFVGNDTIPLAD